MSTFSLFFSIFLQSVDSLGDGSTLAEASQWFHRGPSQPRMGGGSSVLSTESHDSPQSLPAVVEEGIAARVLALSRPLLSEEFAMNVPTVCVSGHLLHQLYCPCGLLGLTDFLLFSFSKI